MMAQFPIPESKAAALELMHLEASIETAKAIDKLRQGSGTRGVQDAVKDVAAATKRVEDAIRKLGAGQIEISEGLRRLAKSSEGIDVSARAISGGEQDNVTAFYAAAVDTSGDIVERTLPGRWLIEAKYGSLSQIAAEARKTNRDRNRDKFADNLIAIRDGKPEFQVGLCRTIQRAELDRFFDLAPSVLKAIEDSKVP